jgi:hypothetical protein
MGFVVNKAAFEEFSSNTSVSVETHSKNCSKQIVNYHTRLIDYANYITDVPSWFDLNQHQETKKELCLT